MNKKQQISRGRKFDQVVAGATGIFLRDGYSGASVDDIAVAAGVSKATLYSYFPDKRLMFEEAIRTEMRRIATQTPIQLSPDMRARDGIALIARQIGDWVVNQDTVSLYRVHVGEAQRFPELAQDYRMALLKLLRDEVTPYLKEWTRRGELDVDDADMASQQLIHLSCATLFATALLDRHNGIKDVEQVAKAASDVFLRAYASETRQRMSAAN